MLAGIGLFLFGMQLMEQAIRHLAGRSFKVFLKNQTDHPIKAILAGLLITALLQSSSIVNLLILAFVGARILSLKNAMAILLGSNLGSTVYNWIVVYLGFKFDIQSFAFPIMAISTVGLIFFQNNKRIMNWTRLAFGISLLFVGLSNIKIGIESFVTAVDLTGFNDYNNFVFVLIGFVITVMVQSSATTVVITLSALNAGALSFETAACIVIGSETGTAIKTVIGSIGNVPDKKRVALGNLILNITSSFIAFIFLSYIIKLIKEILHINDPLIALVSFQSAINIIGIIIFYPLLNLFSKWLEKRFSNETDKSARYLNKLLLNEPEEAISAIQKEGKRLIINIISLNRQALEMYHRNHLPPVEIIPKAKGKSYSEHYEIVKQLNGEIIDFCIELQSKELDINETKRLQELIKMLQNSMSSAKSVKDIRHNIKEFRDSAEDVLHDFYINIKKSEEPFYAKVEEIVNSDSIDQFPYLSELLHETKNLYDNQLKRVYSLSGTHQLQDLDLATILNVFGEIESSRESLINALNAFLEISKSD